MKLFAAALALTLGLAGCGPVDGDPIRSGASAPDSVPRQDAVTVAQLRQQAEQNGSLAVLLYLGSVPERTADVDAALDSLQEQPWQFVTDIPEDHRVTAPGGGRELYCIFAVRREDTLLSTKSRTPSTRTRRAGSSTAGGTASLCCCCATAPRTSPTSRRWSTAPPAARWTGRPSFPPRPTARSRWRAWTFFPTTRRRALPSEVRPGRA